MKRSKYFLTCEERNPTRGDRVRFRSGSEHRTVTRVTSGGGFMILDAPLNGRVKIRACQWKEYQHTEVVDAPLLCDYRPPQIGDCIGMRFHFFAGERVYRLTVVKINREGKVFAHADGGGAWGLTRSEMAFHCAFYYSRADGGPVTARSYWESLLPPIVLTVRNWPVGEDSGEANDAPAIAPDAPSTARNPPE